MANWSFQQSQDGTSDEYEGDFQDYDSDHVLSENVVEDLIKYSRSRTVKNEPQFLLTTLGYLTGLFEDPGHYVCGVLIGTSSSGKTHVQKTVENLIPDDWMYQTTTSSSQALAYDEEWENHIIASLDEMNKPDKEVIEILKSLHGDDEVFKRRVTQDWRNQEMMELERTAMPYWFLYAQFSPDFELWNRLLKIPVHEGKEKNLAVVRKQFDHHNINLGDTDYEYDFDFTDGEQKLKEHIQNLPREAWVKLPAGEEEFGGFDVASVVEPIFDIQRSETNRVAAMVANCIRSSALLNHKNRRRQEIHVPNKGLKEAIIAEPEDVANVLACRNVLLASTHELDRKKMAILDAIEEQGGRQKRCTINDMMDHIRRGNAPVITRTQVEQHLTQLRENYLIERIDNHGEANEYQFQGWHSLGTINIDSEFKSQFDETTDGREIRNPITGENFIEFTRKQNSQLQPGASDFMGAGNSDVNVTSSGADTQQTLTRDEQNIELEPHEEAVRQALHDTLDDEVMDNIHEHDPTLYAMCGVTDLDDPDTPDNVEGTVFDPENRVWNRPDINSEWVEDRDDAFEAVDETINQLHQKGVLQTNTVEWVDNQPKKMEVRVLSEDEL